MELCEFVILFANHLSIIIDWDKKARYITFLSQNASTIAKVSLDIHCKCQLAFRSQHKRSSEPDFEYSQLETFH
jgi:hypothetical protein